MKKFPLFFVLVFSAVALFVSCGKKADGSILRVSLEADESVTDTTKYGIFKCDGESVHILNECAFLESDIAKVDFDKDEPDYLIIEFTKDAGKRFASFTKENMGKRLAVVAGDDVLALAFIHAEIAGGSLMFKCDREIGLDLKKKIR